jgi:hypothetical protein
LRRDTAHQDPKEVGCEFVELSGMRLHLATSTCHYTPMVGVSARNSLKFA